MEDQLHVVVVQADLHWQLPIENMQAFEEKIKAISGPIDIIVLPEMFSSGFTMEAATYAETMEGPGIAAMTKWAKQKQAVVCGSLIIKDEENYYNRLVWMRADGTYACYDKHHLFRLSDEHKTYTAGARHLIVQCKGWNIAPMVCYDLRFPVWCRNEASELDYRGKYDVLLFVANWPERRALAWKTLLQARAIENQCYTIGVNRVGMDGNSIYHSGDSSVIGPLGEVLFQQAHEVITQTITLSKDDLLKTRRTYAFWKDADAFKLV